MKIWIKKYLNKILLSTLLLILAIIVNIIPESKNDLKVRNKNNSSGFFLLENTKHETSGFGHIEVELEGNNKGYGYISDRKDKKQHFAKIDLLEKTDDKEFIARVNTFFKKKVKKYYRSRTYNYAVLEGNKVYIENVGNSTTMGFNGVVDLGVVINGIGEVDSIIYISSLETPSYVRKIIKQGYFEQYKNLDLGKNNIVDAIAGATITTVCIAKSVDELVGATKKDILSDYIEGIAGFRVEAKLSYMWIVNLCLIILLFSLFVMKLFRGKKIRLAMYIFTVIWLGFYLNSSFTYLLLIKAFSGIELSVFTIVYILLVLSTSIWDRNTYCKSICPFGNAQRLMIWVSPFKQKKIPFNQKWLKYFRYFITITITTSYFAGIDEMTSYELFPYLFGLNFSSVILWVSIASIFISLWIPNLYCRAFCTTGCVLDAISDIAYAKKNT